MSWRELKFKVRRCYHGFLCERGKHEYRVKKTTVGAHIGGRYYHECYWCGNQNWDPRIDAYHQKLRNIQNHRWS